MSWTDNATTTLYSDSPDDGEVFVDDVLWTHRVLMGLALCLLALVALVANLLLAFVILRSSQLRTSTNAFVVSIACSDVIFAIFVVLPAALFVNLASTPPSSRSCMASGAFSLLTQSRRSESQNSNDVRMPQTCHVVGDFNKFGGIGSTSSACDTDS